MTAEVRKSIAGIIAMLSLERKEIKPEVLNWLQKRFEEILESKPRYIDVLTLEECTWIRDLICSENDKCERCPLRDPTGRNGCLSYFMTTPYDSKELQKYIDIVKTNKKERKENGTENS